MPDSAIRWPTGEHPISPFSQMDTRMMVSLRAQVPQHLYQIISGRRNAPAWKQAHRAAQDRPLAAQVEAEALEEERVKEQQQLDAAFARMARFREEMARTAGPVATPPAVSDSTQPGKIPDLVAELERLRARVADMEIEREEARKKRSSLSVLSPHLVGGPTCRCENGTL